MSEINLLPEQAPRRARVDLPMICLVVVLGIGLALFSGYYTYALNLASSLEASAATLEATADKAGAVLREASALTKANAELAKRLEFKQAYVDQAVKIGAILNDLRLRVPQDVWLTSFECRPGKPGTMSGAALGYNAVATFVIALQSSPYLTDVGLVKASAAEGPDGQKLVKFTVEFSTGQGGAKS